MPDTKTVGLDQMVRAYIEAALWSSDHDGKPLDYSYCPGDLSPELRESIVADCEEFLKEYAELIGTRWIEAGHDLWLTRNREGSGFWCRPEVYGGKTSTAVLTEAAHKMGERTIYVGDDGKLYQM